MPKTSVTRLLIDHFFRRFFDNDTIQVEGDTTTTVVRALSAVAVPGLMFAFFLQNAYPFPPHQRPLWGSIEDQYFFVLISFVVMGAVTIFEWEMLFPDRLDFLILTPLSIKPRQLLAAKAAALTGFLTLFLAAVNIFGAIVLPAVSKINFFRQVYAHTVATLCAGIFAALFFLALGGILLCVLDAARFRMVSPIVQMLSIMGLVLLMFHYIKYGDSIQAWLANPNMTRWLPPLWFLGIYERLLYGVSAPVFAAPFAAYAFRATAIAALVVVLTYPLAWARMRRMAVEGASRPRRQPARWLTRLVHAIIRRPGERAVFHFITQTIARNNRYQVYLAMYSGTGLALAVACAVGFRVSGTHIQPTLSSDGLRAMMPLLLFWIIAGLRTAFAFPLSLSAGWIFRISGVDLNECAAAARRWVLACALAAMSAILIALRLAHWDERLMLVQAVCGLCLAVLLTDAFFAFMQRVPFNQPRMPGKTNLPLILTLYIGVFPPFIVGVIGLEKLMEKNLLKLLLLIAITAILHIALSRSHNQPAEVEEEMEGYEGEVQLLNLSCHHPIV
jgi:hypothetical protein